MFIPQSYSLAVILCIVTMLCWGSWGNTQKLAGKSWRFELFYWDYVAGIMIFSLLLGFTLGSMGENGRSFIPDIAQAKTGNILNAFLGGVVFNASNILLVAAMAIAGMAVAFPVGVGIALALGVIINYIFTPKGNPVILFAGLALIVAAIIIDAIAYKKHSTTMQKVSRKGILLSVAAGVLMSLFYRFVASSMVTNFSVPEAGKLTPYSALFFFAVGVVISNLLFNYILMKKPIEGNALTFSDYRKGSLKVHLTGILGGLIWNLGMSMSILASDKAGFAISYGLGQGATLVAALWGVFIWKEFKGANKTVNTLIFFMFLAYLAGLALLVYAGA
ncbi:MAG TPA: GRP family sugar transporter [Bacteroidales bacterium]|jgi:glucose uptake protein|nr:GRP family sugar transporter [Bacteroidales bacterium]HOX75347.1 GRP family sugar transporter [Bacteroidales bacterium]HPM87450.1 GRP family sugar transporter [Bacteroidales bacterium]HQM69601.1 GRP family sugar transporter [Bacteroidales bacterium]